MTATEVREHAKITENQWKNVYNRLSKTGTGYPRRIHIHGWTHNVLGKRSYLRAIYALGDLPDKKKPPPISSTKASKDYAKKFRHLLKTASVFNLGVPVKELHRRLKEKRDESNRSSNASA